MILDVTGEKRRYEKVLENLRNSSISENNKRTIYDFLSDKESEEIGYERLIKYVEYLTLISSWLGKDFQDSDIEDLRRVIKKLRRQQWSEWTKASIKAVLKKFYQWLRGYKEGYPPEVSWIKTTIKTGKRKIIPEDLLTEKEVLKLIEACNSPRDKAIIALLYDVGCRPSELLTMRRKNVQFDEYSAIVTLKGKTGMRRVRAVFSTPYLNQWLSLLPKEPEHPLWPYDRGPGYLKREGLRKILRSTAEKAKLKKRVYPYLFRHTRATLNATFMTEAEMCIYFGWEQGSRMPRIYVHLSGREVDDKLLRFYNLKKERERVKEPRKCPVCREINPPNAEICFKCLRPLTESVSIEEFKLLIAKVFKMLEDKKRLAELARELER